MPAQLTLKSLLNKIHHQFLDADLYYGHGTDNAWDEAVFLVLHVMHLPMSSGKEVLSLPLTPEQEKMIRTLAKQRVETKKPLPYLVHRSWFAELEFYIDERALIPRSPFAELIQNHFKPWANPQKISRILDLCTGSGCMAIACAHYLPAVQVDASDISVEALEVAKINIEKHQLKNRVHLIHSDLFENITQQYDIIISNPPYVDAQGVSNFTAEYHHEPSLALAAGEDGLDLAKRILAKAADFLTPNGVLFVEVGNSERALMKKFTHLPFTWLTFTRGGEGIFTLTRNELLKKL